MSYPPPAPSPYASAPKRGIPAAVWVLLGIFALFVLAAICGGVILFRAAGKTAAAAQITSDAFVKDLQRHNYAAADALCTPQAKQVLAASDISDVEQIVEKRRGPITAFGKPQWSASDYNGVAYVRLTYPVTFRSGAQTYLVVTLQREGAVYQVVRFDYSL